MTSEEETPPPAGPEAGFTAHLVSEVNRISSLERSEQVVERARHAVLDWLGVSIAGAQEPSAKAVQQVLTTEGGTPASQLIGTPYRLTARQAALAGGVAAHALDYDDISIGGHPSAVLLPAVFALAEELDADGPTTIEAMLFGYETIKMITVACGSASYDRGFHGTGTFGAFGAAMAAGRLIGLDPPRLRHALGIAGTQASGLRASFGTMAKHLNAGNAAAVGILSARLAEAGFTGDTTILEAPHGFAATHNNEAADFHPTGRGTSLGRRLAVEWIVFKPHAFCGATHSAIDGFQLLRQQHAFAADDVDEAEVFVSAQHQQVCDIPEPRTGVEAMFSIRFAAALALGGRGTGPSGLTTENIQDPAMVALRDRVRVTPVPQVRNITMPTEVRVRLRNGEELTARVNALAVKPDQQLASQWETLQAKFTGLAGPVLGAGRAEEIIAAVRRIETMGSIRELTGLCGR
jgi:2-methylcitrate dehydratase PrpD